MTFPLRWLTVLALLSSTCVLLGCREAARVSTDVSQEDGQRRPPQVERVAGHSAADLGLEYVAPRRDEGSEFIIGGSNPTKMIAALTSINGIRIADLERQMRPGAQGKEGSRAGFLGPSESLLEVMAKDNAFVVDQLKLTHQDLARPLLLLGYFAKNHAYLEPKTVAYGDQLLTVSAKLYKGFQYSPFLDETKTEADITIANVHNGRRLTYSLLVPHMIERYGFYEGHGTSYRVDPQEIVALFEFR